MSPNHDQNSVESKVALFIKNNRLIKAGDRVVVALSGGPDSVALFNILFNLKQRLSISLEACHYNHRLRGRESDADEKFVKKICGGRGVRLIAGSRGEAEIIKNEDDARNLRYDFFEKILKGEGGEEAKIAIAHNLNDLSETLLMRLIRGGGLKGLSSILPRRKSFIRPLLLISRPEIESYLSLNHLEYRVDQSNLDNHYFRNRIRNILLPALKDFNPNIVEKLAENAMTIAEDYDFIINEASNTYNRVVKESKDCLTISAEEYAVLHPAIRSHLIILCLKKFGAKDYTFEQIYKINHLIEQNHGKKVLPLPYSLRFEFKNGNIYICKRKLTANIKENNGKSKKK